MKPSDILRKAAELIADPEKWVRGKMAIGVNGYPTYPHSPEACKWCAYGAVHKISGGEYGVSRAFYYSFGRYLSSINDSEGHAYTIGAMMHVADKMDGI